MQFDPEESKRRKLRPIFDGFIMYFDKAIEACAEFSRINNEKHNPGERLHWSKHKSHDHANCIARHLADIGPDWDGVDPETGRYHAEALFWRSGALLQILLEAKELGMKPAEYLEKLKREAEGDGGWVHWYGGNNPVGTDVVVDYVMRSPSTKGFDTCRAGVLRWNHASMGGDIVKYRVKK